MTTDLEQTLRRATAAREAANKTYWQAGEDGTRAALLELAALVRTQLPTATAVIVGPSDQGDWLDPREIEVPDSEYDDDLVDPDEVLDSDAKDVLWAAASNLDYRWRYVWDPFTTATPGSSGTYRLDLDRILTDPTLL